MLGIIIGVAAVILLVSMGQGLQSYITAQFEQLGANTVAVLPGQVNLEQGFRGPPNFAGSKLTLKQMRGIGNLGGPIDAVGASIEMPATVKYKDKSKYATVVGVTSGFEKVRNVKVGEGRSVQQVDVDLSRRVIILGKDIVKDLFGQSTVLDQEVIVGEERFRVIGILEEIAGGIGIDINNFAIFPITSAQKLFGTNNVQAILIRARSKEEIPDAIDLVRRYLSQELKDDDFSVVAQESLVGIITRILGVLTLALGGIAAISLVVGGVGIMNIMLVSVTERTREIGLRKAVGAKPRDILSQFLIEAVVLSVLGGSIGILLGTAGAFALNTVFVTQVTWWSVILAFGVSASVGIIFGVAPAIRASRLDPIEALRYE
ncbi:MAG: ABC transporter permease [Candidatus Blackburnbacteria bacterium]|nr:ABC transporter permease [Candidatus Blackburnbacteria bacterium]